MSSSGHAELAVHLVAPELVLLLKLVASLHRVELGDVAAAHAVHGVNLKALRAVVLGEERSAAGGAPDDAHLLRREQRGADALALAGGAEVALDLQLGRRARTVGAFLHDIGH